jgi:hypothetical protein
LTHNHPHTPTTHHPITQNNAAGGAFEQELESQLSALLANPTAAVASSATRRPLATPLTAGGSGVRPLSRCVRATRVVD